MLNEESYKSFNAAKGLRQGDSISPFLFAISMEYLSRALNQLKENKEFQCHPKCSMLNLTHLSFTYDLLLFFRGNMQSIKAIHRAFLLFSTATGLQPNLAKCFVYFGGVTLGEKEKIHNHLGFAHSELPFKYLGIPLPTKKLSPMQWQSLIDKIITRISSWTTKKSLLRREGSTDPSSVI